MVEWKKFGDRVAGARRKLELSQRRVAGILGMRPSDYADMERGFKEPGEFFTIAWETIEKWAAGDEFQQQTKQQTNGNQKNRNQS
jgi:transcriptional regulator with XRE-family HTH domain